MTLFGTKPHPTTEMICLRCDAPVARSVCLIGAFNQWDPKAHPMERNQDGSWTTRIPLSEGVHHYQFLVDGEPWLDAGAMCVFSHERRARVSLVAIS